MSTNSGQLWPASNPVNCWTKANRPKTTRTTPNATLDPARRDVGPGATYEGGRGWEAGGGGALTAVSVATAPGGWAAANAGSTPPKEGEPTLYARASPGGGGCLLRT